MEEIVLNSGDTAWILASTALVLLMTPGLAFFYGGMVRTKSVLNMMMMSIITIAIVSILWVIYGFELAFGYKAESAWYGNISFSGLGSQVNEFTNNGGVYPIPVLVFAAFQLMFAIITPALISGAIADRAKFSAWAVFVAIWSTVVYFPVAHWVFAFGNKVGDTVTGTGFLAGRGVEDFAGGTAVHINAGAAALALAIILGKRHGWRKDPMRPHSLPLVMLGAGLLWFGWFGFNAASTFASTDVQFATVAANTAIAGAFGGIIAMFWITKRTGKPDPGMMVNGMLAGLVAITAPCAFVAPWAAAVIGSIAAVLAIESVFFVERKLKIDDPVGAISVHGVCGLFGVLAVGIFSNGSYGAGWNGSPSEGIEGIIKGDWGQLGAQALSAGIIVTVIFGIAFAFFKIQNALTKGGIRSKEEDEIMGLDLPEMGVAAYPEFSLQR
jgi:Amt family ammonium transporter